MPPSTSSGSLTHLDLPSQSPSSSSTAARLLTPTTQQIPLLDSLLARRYNQIHTLLIPAYYYLRSSSLIADPLPTLVQDLVFVTLAQTAYVATSLPSAGNWVSGTNAGRIIEGTASYGSGKTGKSGNVSSTGSLRKKAGVISSASGAISAGSKNSRAVGSSDHNSGGSWRGRAVPTLLSLILAFALPPLPLAVVALVLGAPLYPTTLLPHTLLLSLHVSLLGYLPLFYSHGVSTMAWRDITAAWLPFDESGVWAGTFGVMVGGWIGAIPIALDWDRDWQKWPCTVIWGCVLGWTVGRIVTSSVGLGVGRRINLSEKEEQDYHDSQPQPQQANTGGAAELVLTSTGKAKKMS